MIVTRTKIPCVFLLSLFIQAAHAQSVEIERFSTIHGEVAHLESAAGKSSLKFLTKGNNVQLPASWGAVAVEQVTPLNGQTAILMSHSDTGCASRMSLAVVSKDTLWGPYAVGECEDILLHQRSSDGNDLIAVRADASAGMAWVYSVTDSKFRGPVSVTLPDSMAIMIPKPAERAIPPARPAASPSLAPAPRPAPVSAAAATPAVPPKAPSPVKPAPQPVRPAGISPQEASAVASQTRRAPAAQVIRIDL